MIKEFDFAAWIAEPPGGTFGDAVRAAVDCLAIEDGDLRSRLVGAVFCVCCRERKIPERLKPDVAAIREEIKLPGDTAEDSLYGRLAQWAAKCKLRTALRIARKIVALERGLSSAGALSAAGPPGGSLLDGVRAAVDCLAFEDGNLRSRLVNTVYCLYCCRERDVPESFKPEVAAIRRELRLPPGHGEDSFYERLQTWGRKCKRRTAQRIARKIVLLERGLAQVQRA